MTVDYYRRNIVGTTSVGKFIYRIEFRLCIKRKDGFVIIKK